VRKSNWGFEAFVELCTRGLVQVRFRCRVHVPSYLYRVYLYCVVSHTLCVCLCVAGARSCLAAGGVLLCASAPLRKFGVLANQSRPINIHGHTDLAVAIAVVGPAGRKTSLIVANNKVTKLENPSLGCKCLAHHRPYLNIFLQRRDWRRGYKG
jgi:hypothetical protein